MKIVDLNILLYAVNSAAAQHERARRWWENAVSDEDGIGLAWVVLLGGSGTAGNLTTDAHLATLALSHDAVLVSSDMDFARFQGLRWENPLQS